LARGIFTGGELECHGLIAEPPGMCRKAAYRVSGAAPNGAELEAISFGDESVES